MDREKVIEIIKDRGEIASAVGMYDWIAEAIADELIANGIGDITAENAKWDILCNKLKRYSGEYDELKYRAEVAEEALKLACEKAYDIRVSMDTLSCSSCWLFEEHGMCYTHDKFEAGSECYDKWQEHFIQQAEKRLRQIEGGQSER